MRVVHLLALSVVIATTAATADEAAVMRYRNYTAAQIAKLTDAQRNSEVPIMYSLAARRALSPGADVVFGFELNRLMYGGVHDFSKAVRAFQSDLGDEPTGQLTVWQIHQLEQRSEMQALSEISFPDTYTSYIDTQFASVEGTMIIVDDNIAWPINHARVKCFKSSGQCELTQAYLVVPDENSWTQTYQLMLDDTDYYTISRWSEEGIESHPLGGDDDCRNTSLTFNFKTKEFYFITRNAGGDCKVLGAELEKLKKPRIAQIVDGSSLIATKFAEVKKKAFDVLANDFRKKVESLAKAEKDRERNARPRLPPN